MILKLLGTAVAALLLGVGIFFAGPQPQQAESAPLVGSFSPTGGGTYRLGQSIGVSDSSFKLSSFKEPVSNIPYTMSYLGSDVGYGTISPQTSVSEFVSFTGVTQNSDGSALLTGVSRGISRTPGSGGCVASTTLAQAHAGQSIFILSNQPCFYVNEYVPLRQYATSSAILTFGSTTMPRYDLDPTATQWNNATNSVLVSLGKLNSTAIAGASNSTQSVNGISQLATGAQAGSSTLTGSTGANLALSTIISTSSPFAAGSYVVVTQPNNKIRQNFLDLTEAFTWTGLQTWSNATNVFTGTNAKVGIGTSTPYAALSVVGSSGLVMEKFFATSSTATSTIAGNLQVSTNATTTTLVVSNGCVGCTNAVQVTNSFSAPTAQGGSGSAAATCTGNKVVSGGGYSGIASEPTNGTGNEYVNSNGPSASNAWSVTVFCGNTACNGGTVTVYAICVNP